MESVYIQGKQVSIAFFSAERSSLLDESSSEARRCMSLPLLRSLPQKKPRWRLRARIHSPQSTAENQWPEFLVIPSLNF